MISNSVKGKMSHDESSDLLANQKKRMDALDKFITNYGKDGTQRKSVAAYFESKKRKLNAWYDEFKKTHDELVGLDEDQDDEYFTQSQYSKVVNQFNTFYDKVENDLKKLNDKLAMRSTSSSSTSNDSAIARNEKTTEKVNFVDSLNGEEDDEFEEAQDEQNIPPEVRVLRFQMNEMKNLLRSITNENNIAIGMASAQLDMVKMSWNELRSTHRSIIASEHSNCCENVNLNEIQAEFLTVCGKLIDIVESRNEKTNVNASLPKLKLPEFDGKSSWRDFRELFDEIVHNNSSLNERTKAQYLKTVLKGEAATVLSHLGANGGNYQSIYDALVERYHNKRKLVNELIEKIANIPKQTNETSGELRRMHDTVKECLNAIANLGVSIQDWDPLIVHMLTRKLCKTTILEYESKLENVREIQKLSEFLKYIENRFLALQSSERSEKVNVEHSS